MADSTGYGDLSRITRFFAHLAETGGVRGPIGGIVECLARADLSSSGYTEICRKHGVGREPWFRGQVLDLVLGYVADALQRGPLSPDVQDDVRVLRLFLHIPDGEFVSLRAAEVASLLANQLEQILEDWEIDPSEELYQVELQSAFGLSYDDYLRLIRGPLERAFAELSALNDDSDESGSKLRKLSALEPMYRLAISRTRTLGALY